VIVIVPVEAWLGDRLTATSHGSFSRPTRTLIGCVLFMDRATNSISVVSLLGNGAWSSSPVFLAVSCLTQRMYAD
jgi:hypothetical protein